MKIFSKTSNNFYTKSYVWLSFITSHNSYNQKLSLSSQFLKKSEIFRKNGGAHYFAGCSLFLGFLAI